jgi:hypothetical protein
VGGRMPPKTQPHTRMHARTQAHTQTHSEFNRMTLCCIVALC